MNRILLIAALIASPCYAQEAWLDEVEVQVETPEVVEEHSPLCPEYIDPLEKRIETLEEVVAENLKTLSEVAETLKTIAAMKAPVPTLAEPCQCDCQCDCDCPTIDEIRQVVREELQAVMVELRNAKGESKTVAVPLTTPSKPQVRSFSVPSDGGWYVTAIDGVPCEPKQVETAAGTTTSYQTPSHEVRTYPYSGQVFGAARQTRPVFESFLTPMRNLSQCANGKCN